MRVRARVRRRVRMSNLEMGQMYDFVAGYVDDV